MNLQVNYPTERRNWSIRRFLSNFYILSYMLLVAPPRAIDLTVRERSLRGELEKLPLFVVMLLELVIRSALVLVVAVVLEANFGKVLYETYQMDRVFFALVILGGIHSVCYYLVLGYLRPMLGLSLSMRIYRLLRNLCYAALPGFAAVVPVLVWQWTLDREPFAGDIVTHVYLVTTAVMVAAGVLEALIVKRKPLGLDHHLKEDA